MRAHETTAMPGNICVRCSTEISTMQIVILPARGAFLGAGVDTCYGRRAVLHGDIAMDGVCDAHQANVMTMEDICLDVQTPSPY